MLWLDRKEGTYLINTLDITIWGRDFSLPIEYDCYKDEEVTKEQIMALKEFSLHDDWITASQKIVKTFCKEQVMEDEENKKKDNIFSYVKPDYLFVKRDGKNPRVALMCRYRYDLEHGLAVVFSKDGNIDVGSQDIIL